MYQDSAGYLWSGGFGGLSRFEGKTFTNFGLNSGIIDRSVNAILAHKGLLFVGTNKGLSIWTGKKFKNYSAPNGLKGTQITSFCKGYHHSVYIGTSKGLFMMNDSSIKEVGKLKSAKINCLLNPDTSVIYIGTNKGLVIYGHNTYHLIDQSNGLPNNQINAISKFKNFIVIGTDKGLCFLNLKTRKTTTYFIEQGLIDEKITSLCNQNNRYLWVASQTGLLRFDGKNFDYYNIGNDNNSNNIQCIIQDREDNIWLGTLSGLYRYRDNSFSTFDKINGPGNAFIFQIFRDRNKNLWLGTTNNGIYKYSQGYFKRYGSADGLPTVECKAGMEDNEGRLLFGTRKAVVQFSNEKFSQVKLPAEFAGPYEMLLQTKDQRTWIAGGNGIAYITWNKNKAQVTFRKLPAKRAFQVYGFCEDEAGNLYIGTSPAGLFMLKGDSIHDLNDEFQLNEEDFFAIKYYQNKLFAATLKGLLVIDTKTHKTQYINELQGLNSDLVYSAEFTKNKQYLWIGTNQGINRLDLDLFIKTGTVQLNAYGKLQGFLGVECNSNGIWEDDDGSVWFGTVSGLVKHEPIHLKKNFTENNTIIQSIQINNNDTFLTNNSELSSHENSITFHYRGICLTNPDKVLYKKKLEGLKQDNRWSEPSSEDYSKYVNLPPGNYTFSILSSNNEGIWNTKPTSFSFTIKRPFYTSWWFISAILILIAAIIYVSFVIRVYNIKKRQQLDYERKVEMSKIELKALRSQMNPHFVFNSLNAIQHYIFKSESDDAIKYLNKFARLVRVILNNSERPTVTVGDDLESLKLYLELEQMRFEGKFEYEIIIDDSVDIDYDIMPPLLMQPYVENAILHGLNPKTEKGKLTIHLSSGNNFLICTITDNGIGREKSSEIKHTMPFRKYKSLGMKITEDRLKIINEINNSRLSVTITDLKDEFGNATGTKVELFVPLTG